MSHRFLLIATFVTRALAAQSSQVHASIATVTGTVQFEKLQVDRTGLHLDAKWLVPAVGVIVQLVREDSRVVIAKTITDDQGHYAMRAPVTRSVRAYLRALAQNRWATVHNHEKVSYSVFAPDAIELTAGIHTINLTAVDANRGAGPFNILDTITRANRFLRPYLRRQTLPPLPIEWDTEYSGGTKFSLGGSYQAYINGNRLVNSDEYDDTVILHEYAHLLESKLSAPITVFGHHTLVSELDPRSAWVEGWADYFSAAVTGLPVYVDSQSTEFQTFFTIEWEPNSLPHVPLGPWSEHTVASTLWDLASSPPGDREADHLAMEFAPLWAVFRGPFRSVVFPDITAFSNEILRRNPQLPWSDFFKGRGLVVSRNIPRSVENPSIIALPLRTLLHGFVDSRSGTIMDPHQNARLATALFSFTSSRPQVQKIILRTTSSIDPQNARLTMYLRSYKIAAIADTGSQPGGLGRTQEITISLGPGTYIVEVRSWRPERCNQEEIKSCNQAEFTIERTAAPSFSVPSGASKGH